MGFVYTQVKGKVSTKMNYFILYWLANFPFIIIRKIKDSLYDYTKLSLVSH